MKSQNIENSLHTSTQGPFMHSVCVCVYYGVSERRESIVLRKNWSLESGWLLSASPRAAVQVPFKSICTIIMYVYTTQCTQPSDTDALLLL